MIKRELALLDERAATVKERLAAIERADKEITIMIKEREAAVAETLVKNQSLRLRLRNEAEQIGINNIQNALTYAEQHKADAHMYAVFKDFALRGTANLAPVPNILDALPVPNNHVLHNVDISGLTADMGLLAQAKNNCPQ